MRTIFLAAGPAMAYPHVYAPPVEAQSPSQPEARTQHPASALGEQAGTISPSQHKTLGAAVPTAAFIVAAATSSLSRNGGGAQTYPERAGNVTITRDLSRFISRLSISIMGERMFKTLALTRMPAALFISASVAILPLAAQAGQEANFVLYNHYMEEKGATEVEVYSDYGHVGKGEPNYTAQLVELEYGVTELFTTSVYLEGLKTFDQGEDYEFGSFRFENRLRLFKDETLLNPVLYAEYEYKTPNSRFVRSVVGRTDGREPPEGSDEHELETKLILGHDFSSNLNVAFNVIQEINFSNDNLLAFGYAAGLNYAFFNAYDAPDTFGDVGDTALQKLTLGFELYGGLGDAGKGLTLDGDLTEQYAGVNLRADFKNEMHVGIGGAFGLTNNSEDAIVRVTAGYEFE